MSKKSTVQLKCSFFYPPMALKLGGKSCSLVSYAADKTAAGG